jgi:hypothetical protein
VVFGTAAEIALADPIIKQLFAYNAPRAVAARGTAEKV